MKRTLVIISIFLLVFALGCINNQKATTTTTSSSNNKITISVSTTKSETNVPIISTSTTIKTSSHTIISRLAPKEYISLTDFSGIIIYENNTQTISIYEDGDSTWYTMTLQGTFPVGGQVNIGVSQPAVYILDVYGYNDNTWSVLANFPGNKYFWTGSLIINKINMTGTLTMNNTTMIVSGQW